jgi:methanogenic corrinoid protein MtbC1
MDSQLIDAIVEMREGDALDRTRALLSEGTDPLQVLEACRQAMTIIGERFECGESFIPELMLGGEILRQITEITKPLMTKELEEEKIGKVVIGTVEGDIHDIAKDIVVFMLDINGFEVFDLGVDVSAQAFVDKVKETGAVVVGLSGFLTSALEPMKATVDAFSSAGLRDQVKIMIGGGPINEQVHAYTRSDGWGSDAGSAVRLAKEWSS